MNADYLTTEDAARILDLSPLTLIKWRSLRKGPAWVKLGGKVRYRPLDLETYLNSIIVQPEGM
jgi:hypothetical protein